MITLPFQLPPSPGAPLAKAPVIKAPVPMAPVLMAPVSKELGAKAAVPVAARSFGNGFQEPESRPVTPAIIEFRGFPPGPGGARPRAFLLADAGDPPRAARWFETALARAAEPAQFAAACLGTAPAHLGPLGPLEPLGEGRRDGKVAYRYRLGLAPVGGAGLRLQCWRCYGEQLGWQRRCGPMALGAFVAHFGANGGPAGTRA